MATVFFCVPLITILPSDIIIAINYEPARSMGAPTTHRPPLAPQKNRAVWKNRPTDWLTHSAFCTLAPCGGRRGD